MLAHSAHQKYAANRLVFCPPTHSLYGAPDSLSMRPYSQQEFKLPTMPLKSA